MPVSVENNKIKPNISNNASLNYFWLDKLRECVLFILFAPILKFHIYTQTLIFAFSQLVIYVMFWTCNFSD